MPIIQSRTREQLRVSVGSGLGAIRRIEADSAGTNTTFITDALSLGGADEHIGKWMVFTSGTNDGSIRRVTDSAVSGNRQTLTWFPSVAAATADSDTAELWDERYNPEDIHEFINQSIMDVTNVSLTPLENITLHGDGSVARFDIPSGIVMINRVEYRSGITSRNVHLCERVFDETADSNFTISVDSKDKKGGSSSLKLVISSGVSSGDFVTDSISSLDLSNYTHIEGWVKATSTLAASDFVLHLDSGAVLANGSDLESLNIPATIAADTWTFFRVALANPELDTAIISIGVEYNDNQGANTVWFDEIRATKSDSETWTTLPNNLWSIDRQARDLIFQKGARGIVGYALLKLVGGNQPALLTTDATANEIDDAYVIARTIGLALTSEGGGTSTDTEARFQRGQSWLGRADVMKVAIKASFWLPVGARMVE